MIVVDGIAMGHKLCAMQLCPNPPSDFHSRKLCAEHQLSHGHLCGIEGCEQPLADEPPNTGACSLAAHQARWHLYSTLRTRATFGGYRHILRDQLSHRGFHFSREDAPWAFNAHQNVAQDAGGPEDIEQIIPHHHNNHVPDLPQERLRHSWHYRKLHCIETITHPCGRPIAWSKFYVSESPTNIINMLTELYPDHASRPSFIVIDKACHVLATLSANGAADDWFQTSRFIVDSFHFKHHRNEPRCQEFCNPAPTNGSQPNLVHPVQIPNGQVCYRQAFNTEAAEQLNVWLHKYSGQLSHMHPYHHDFLLQVMFTHHFESLNE